VPVVCNQIQCSLISDYDGDVAPAIEVGQQAGIVTLGYSCLGLGLLGNPNPSQLSFLRSAAFKAIADCDGAPELLAAVDEVARRNDATRSQVAIGWCLEKGVSPLFGVRTGPNVVENLTAVKRNWRMDATDFLLLEEARGRLAKKARETVSSRAEKRAAQTRPLDNN